MANAEMGLLSKIVRHDCLKQAIEWGLLDEDFLTDEGRAVFQHMVTMIRDPRFNGSTPGLNVMALLYPNFDMCDDPSMSLEAYCTMVRDNRLSVVLNGAIRESLTIPQPTPAGTARRLVERLRHEVLCVAEQTDSQNVKASSFAEQPSDEDLRGRMLVPDLNIGPGAPTLLVAPGFTGKTTLVQALGLAVASGQPAWGAFPTRVARVLHIDGEQGPTTTQQRYRQIARAMQIPLQKLDSLCVRYRPPPLLRLQGHRALVNEEEWRTLSSNFDLVIVDNLAALTHGLIQENSSEMRAPLDMLGRISEETQVTFVVLHHTTKPRAERSAGRASVRGSGAIFEAASTVLMAERKGEVVRLTRGRPAED